MGQLHRFRKLAERLRQCEQTHVGLVEVFGGSGCTWLGGVLRLVQSDARCVEETFVLVVTWHGGKLKVGARIADDPEIFDHLSVSLLQVWTFQTFSDIRWITLVSSVRTILYSMLLGL